MYEANRLINERFFKGASYCCPEPGVSFLVIKKKHASVDA